MSQELSKKLSIITIWIGISTMIVLGIFLIINVKKSSYTPPSDSIAIDPDLQKKIFLSAPFRGNADSKLTIIEFGDFQCPFCKQVAPVLQQVINKYENNIQHIWIYVNNPAYLESKSAAIASECANQQNKFWAYHDLLFDQQDKLSLATYNEIARALHIDLEKFHFCIQNSETNQIVENHNLLAQQFQVDATPYVIINNQPLSGAFTFEEIDQIIQEQLFISSQ